MPPLSVLGDHRHPRSQGGEGAGNLPFKHVAFIRPPFPIEHCTPACSSAWHPQAHSFSGSTSPKETRLCNSCLLSASAYHSGHPEGHDSRGPAAKGFTCWLRCPLLALGSLPAKSANTEPPHLSFQTVSTSPSPWEEGLRASYSWSVT